MAQTLEALLTTGDLEEGLRLVRAQLTANPSDAGLLLTAFSLQVRLHLFDEADAGLQRLLALAPQAAQGLSAYGRYARAEKARLARLTDPQLAGARSALLPPPPHLLSYSAAAVQHAQGHREAAAAALAEAEASRPRTPGTLTQTSGRSTRFVDLVDPDALTGATFPCFGGDALLDVPFSQLRVARFPRGSTALDSLWLPAELVLADGQLAHVRVPSLYPGSGVSPHAGARAGRSTLFFYDAGYAVGAGQRDLELIDEDGGKILVGILSVARLDFDAPASLPS